MEEIGKNYQNASVSKYSPFEILYGCKVNSFQYDGYQVTEEDKLPLYQRVDELKELVEIIRPNANENISNKQEKQMDKQDKRHNILMDRLEIGTTVNVKNEGLINKMEPRYLGP